MSSGASRGRPEHEPLERNSEWRTISSCVECARGMTNAATATLSRSSTREEPGRRAGMVPELGRIRGEVSRVHPRAARPRPHPGRRGSDHVRPDPFVPCARARSASPHARSALQSSRHGARPRLDCGVDLGGPASPPLQAARGQARSYDVAAPPWARLDSNQRPTD